MRGVHGFLVIGVVLGLAALSVAQAPAFQLRPLKGGPIEMAVVCPRYTALDAQALVDRADVSLRTVYTWSRGSIGFDPETESGAPEEFSREKVGAALAGLLGKKPAKVLVLANLDLAALPEEFAQAVRGHVEGGAGLALSYCAVPESGPWQEFLSALQPVEESPAFDRGVPEAFSPDGTALSAAATAMQLGAGRVVSFNWAGDVPQYHSLFPPPAAGIDPDVHHADHACLLWTRVLLWLAQREQGAHIMSIANVSPDGPNESETPPDLPEEFVQSMRDTVVAQLVRPFAIALNAPAEEEYRLDLQVRPVFQRGPGYHTDNTIPNGSALVVPQLLCGSGVYFVDAAIYRKKELVDNFSQQVSIQNWPEFESLRADKTYLQANDTLTIEVQVRPVYSEHRSATIYAQALDSYGRLVAQAWQPVDHQGGRVLLNLTFADLIAPLVEVRIVGLEGPPRTVTAWDLYGGSVDTLRFPVHFSRNDAEMHWTIALPALGEENAAAYLKQLSALGATHVVAPGGRPALVSAARIPMLIAPLAAEYAAESAGPGFSRVPSFNDISFAEREDERLRDEVLDYFAGGSGAYVLGNPAMVVASDENASQDAASIESFRDWAERRQLTVPDGDEELGAAIAPAESGDAPHGALYAAFRQFTEEGFAAFLGARRATLRKAQPDATVGIIAGRDDNPYHGYEWHALARELDFVAAAWEPLALFKLSSYGRRTPLAGVELPQADAPWLAAMAGFSSLWTDAPLSGPGLLGPDGTATAFAASLSGELHRLNGTLAPLLYDAVPEPGSVAIIDAPASRFATVESYGAYHQAQLQWARDVARLGYWPTFRHVDELLSAAKEGVKVLAWCDGTVLDTKQQEDLKGFAAQGGMVLCSEGACEAAKAAAGPDAVVCVSDGNGLGAALAEKEITAPVPLDAGELAKSGGTSLLVRSFRYGQARIVISAPWPVAEEGKPRGLTVEFGKEGQVFRPAVKERKGTGGRRVHLNPEAPECAVYLPYKVADFSMEAPESVAPGARVEVACSLSTDTLKPGRHLILLELSPPTGVPIPGGTRTFACENGRGRGYVSVPLNAIPGDYSLRARDLLSGLESHKMVEVLAVTGPGFHALH